MSNALIAQSHRDLTQGRGRVWTVLLDGPLASRASETVRAIAEALRVPSPTLSTATEEDQAIEHASLANGRAGLAVFYAHFAQALLADHAADTASQFLEEATAALGDVRMPPGLYSGFTGVAWAVAHLHDSDASSIDDLNAEVDEALREYLAYSPWTGDYDLVSGLVGVGVYALERLPSRGARILLSLVVDRLEETAQRDERGITWFTPPELLPGWQRVLCPRGYHNLGLAHGVPGVIAVLAGACAAGVRRSKTRRLLDGAVRWLLSQKLAADAGARFPSWIVERQESRPGPSTELRAGRLAWCYGDPGIAASLLAASRAVGVPSWEREALDVARRAAARPPDEAGVRDAGLCHGAAGLAHIFNRMYQATGDGKLAEAARFWFTKTLDMREPGSGIAGYRANHGEVDGAIRRVGDPGLLNGAAGIALALLAAVSPVEPAWDRMLLVSLRSPQPLVAS